MPRRARLPDGRILQFPDNTPDAVIDRVAKREIAAMQQVKPAPTAPVGTPEDRRQRAANDAELTRLRQRTKGAEQEISAADKFARENPFLASLADIAQTMFGGPTATPVIQRQEALERQQRYQAAAERRQAEEKRTGKAIKPLTLGRTAVETVKAVPRGAIESTAQAAGLLGALGEEGEQIAKGVEGLGARAVRGLGLQAAEGVQFDPLAAEAAKIGGGFGSVVPYLVTGGTRALAGAGSMLARGAGGAQLALATGQGATQARQQMDEYQQQTGQQVDPTTRQWVQLGGGAIGLTELLPIPGMISRLPAGLQKTATARITNLMTRVGMGKLAPEAARTAVREAVQELESVAVGRVGMRALEEALQEGGSQFAQNVLERLAYNEEQDLTENVAENAAIGAIVGGGVRTGTEVAQRFLPDRQAQLAEAETALQRTAPLESVEIAVPNPDDPNIINRERVDILSAPDEKGNVVFRRSDGKIQLMSVESLDSMRVPEEGAFIPEGDAFSGEMIYGRLKAAAGEKPNKQTTGFTEALNRKLANNLALGRVQDAADYISALEKRFSGVRKKQAASEAAKGGISAIQDPALRVLFEAKSILNDYRVEFAKQQAQPGVTVGEAAPPPTQTLAQILERNQAARDEDRTTRRELLQQIATDPDIVDKHSAYAEALADYGLDETTDAEATTLLDVMRMESAFETADIQGRASVERQAAIRRAEIIEDALSDPNIDLPNRIRKVNADLMRAGFEPTSPEEVSRIRGRSFAEDVFGPRGEYQRRLDAEAGQRQSVLDSIMADESITDKYRAFVELADQMNLAPPSAGELDMMREAVAEGATQAQPSRMVEEEATFEATQPEMIEEGPVEDEYNPNITVAQIEDLLAEEGLTPDSPEFYANPEFADLLEEYLAAKAAAAQEGAPELPTLPPVDLSPVEAGKNMKERKAAAVSIVQELTADQAVTKKLINQAATQIAQRVARGEAVDVQSIIDGVLGTPAPEAAAPKAAATEEPAVPVTKVAPGRARGLDEPVNRGSQGVVRGRPVEGAAELTAGMQDEQELNKRLRNMRNSGLISDQDVAEVLNLIRVPTSQEALNAMPTSQRERWTQVLDLSRDMEAKAEQRDQTENKKDKDALSAAIKALDAQLDAVRSKLANYAINEASMRVAKRKLARKKIDEDYAAGEITKAERDQQLAELRVQLPLAPVLSLREDAASELITNPDADAEALELSAREEVAEGVEQIVARLDQAVADGDMSPEHADFAKWVLKGNPNIAKYVQLFVSRNTGQPYAGQYDPLSRLIEVVSSAVSRDVAVHEILHHAERLMPESAQRGIYDLWKRRLGIKRGVAAGPEKSYYDAIYEFYFGDGDVRNLQAARMLISDRSVPRSLYQYMSPSEFWAENATDILRQRYNIKDSVVGRIQQWMKEFVSHFGSFVGLPTRSPIIRQLNQLASTTGASKAASLIVGGTAPAFAVENQLSENPNNSRAGQVGIMSRLQQVLKPYAKARSAIARKLNYKYQDIVDYDKQLAAIYGVDQLPDNMAVSHKAELLEASRAGKQVLLDRTFIQPIMKKIAELELDEQDVGMYLWARSAKDRNALVRSRNAEFPEAGAGMSDAEAEAILKDYALRGLEPKLKELAKMHDRLVDYLLNLRVQEGLLTRAQADAARKLQPFYTPLKGYAAEGDMQTMGEESPHNDGDYQRNLGIRRTEYTKSQGRKSMPYNPLLMLFADAKQVIQRASINRVGQQFLDNLIGDPEANADVATYYTDDDPKVKIKPSENTEYPDGIPVRSNMRMEKGQYLVVKRNGTPYYIEFANTDAGQALKRAFDNMTPKQLEGFMRFWVRGANTVKSLLTRYSPPYLPRAYVRDIMDAVANAYAAETDTKSPAFSKKLGAKVAAYSTPASKTGRLIDAAIFRYVSGTEPGSDETAEMVLLLEQMMEDGGSPGHSVVHDLELMTKEATDYLKRARELKAKDPVRFAKEAPQAVLATLNATAEMIDLKARLATYVAAIESGINREGAARLALNSSLNLTRRGEWARALDSTFFFFSPAVESARRFKNMALNTSNGRKIILTQMAIGGMLTLWNMMMGAGDDDEDGRPNWMDLPDATKQTSLVIMTGPGSDDYIALPLGFMLGFPTYAGQKLTEAAYGLISPEAASISIADSLTAIPKAAVTTFSPVKPQGEDAQQFASSFLPNLVKPFGDIAINRNYFGTPIYTEQFDSDRAASSLGREDTGRAWKWIARSLNDMSGGYGGVPGAVDFAPEAYRYFFEAHAGGLYRFGEDTYKFITEDNKDDKTLTQRLPVVRSYVGKGGEYVPMTQYYKNAEKVGALVRQEKYEPDDFAGAMEKFPVQTDYRVMEAYKEAEKQRDQLGRERREELLGTSDPSARRDIIADYRDREREVFMEFNRIFNEVKAEYQ